MKMLIWRNGTRGRCCIDQSQKIEARFEFRDRTSSSTYLTGKKKFVPILIVLHINTIMLRSAKEKGKAPDRESKVEAFSQLLMGEEEDFDGYLQENETLEEDYEEEEEEEEPASVLDSAENEEDEDDNDSLNEWMQDDDGEMDDNEIT